MWFNIVMHNHGPVSAYYSLSHMMEYMRGALSKCGHDVTLGHDRLYADAINLYFEHFADEDVASKILEFKYTNSIHLGVIATELMRGGTIPYSKHGIVYTDKRDKEDKEKATRNRVAGFRKVAHGADFIWSFLERNVQEYAPVNPLTRFFPVGHVSTVPPELRRSPKDIDVVFFGTSTPHRVAVLKCLVAEGINVVAVGRDFPVGFLPPSMIHSLLDRAKIGLNLPLHAQNDGPPDFDPRFVSCGRVTEMFGRDLCVVSEEIPFDNPYKDYMISAEPGRIAAVCRGLLEIGSWAQLGATSSAAFRRQMDVTKVCAPVIQNTIDELMKAGRSS